MDDIPKPIDETPEFQPESQPQPPQPAKEIGGSTRPDPTRYGDWEIGGRCIDF